MIYRNCLSFVDIVKQALFIIESDKSFYFNTKRISLRIIRGELKNEGEEISGSLIISFSHYIGNLLKALEFKGYIEKYSRKYWKRIKPFSLKDKSFINEILWLSEGLRKSKNRIDLLPFYTNPVMEKII